MSKMIREKEDLLKEAYDTIDKLKSQIESLNSSIQRCKDENVLVINNNKTEFERVLAEKNSEIESLKKDFEELKTETKRAAKRKREY